MEKRELLEKVVLLWKSKEEEKIRQATIAQMGDIGGLCGQAVLQSTQTGGVGDCGWLRMWGGRPPTLSDNLKKTRVS